jgi:hypothetical protein
MLNGKLYNYKINVYTISHKTENIHELKRKRMFQITQQCSDYQRSSSTDPLFNKAGTIHRLFKRAPTLPSFNATQLRAVNAGNPNRRTPEEQNIYFSRRDKTLVYSMHVGRLSSN